MTRDRLTWLCYVLLGVSAWYVYGFGPVVPLLGREQDISRAVAALHGTIAASGAVLTGMYGPRVIKFVGRGRALWSGLAGMCVGVTFLIAAPSTPGTLAAAFIASANVSLVLNLVSAILSDHHGPRAGAALSEGNAVAAGVGAVSPLALGTAEGIGLGWRVALIAVLPMATATAVIFARNTHIEAPATAMHSTTGRLPRVYWLAWATVVFCIAVEFSYTTWASELVRVRAGVTAAAGTAAVSALVAGIAIGRIAGGRLALRWPVDTLLLGALALTVAGFAVTWLSSTLTMAVVGLAVSGLGIALQYPLGVARAIEASAGQPDLATARLGLGVGLAFGSAPFMLGALADRIGVTRAFLVVPGLLGAAGCTIVIRRRVLRSLRGTDASNGTEG